uniref:Uncharacterized protein n=1 Tax=Hirsutella rhossiliensis TaxID=111463 RepID=A0A3G4R7Q7_9HYPO|nr:hypothetical protein [Hirsutella rhossiliensis]
MNNKNNNNYNISIILIMYYPETEKYKFLIYKAPLLRRKTGINRGFIWLRLRRADKFSPSGLRKNWITNKSYIDSAKKGYLFFQECLFLIPFRDQAGIKDKYLVLNT